MKTINLDLTTIDSNAFSLMGAFSSEAKHENWVQPEIDAVLEEAKNGDYNHLVATISDYCEPITRDLGHTPLGYEYDDYDEEYDWDEDDDWD